MCDPCSLSRNLSGTSDTSSMGHVEGRNEDTNSTFQNKNESRTELQDTKSKSCEEGGALGGNTNFTSIVSPCRYLFASINIEVKPDEPRRILNNLISKNNDRLIFGHLNINFIENKFEPLVSLVKDKLDIIMVSETKIDESFPESQFIIEGYSKPFRRDRNSHGGGILIYIRDDIPCKEIKTQKLPGDIEGIFIEINLRNNKWILIGGYNPQKESICYFLTQVSKELDKLLGNYDNILMLGDFNSSASEKHMKDFCEMYDLQNLITGPTCFKNANNPSSIDVMLTNRKNSFQNSMTIETGLSDHHKMTVSVLKTYFKKKKPIKINYRSYKYFNESEFRNDLLNNLEVTNKESIQYDEFKHIFMKVLDCHAPNKSKTVRGNNAPFMNKVLSKAFMHRSKLKNQYNKAPNEKNKSLYRKQRNFCVNLLRKEKRKYYNNLDLKIFEDNKKFWKSVKPLFSNKQNALQNNIIIVEKDTITPEDSEVAAKLNNFFI